jgi:hypothetical protein
MIKCTGKLLLAQIKMLLDKSLMEIGHFEPQIAKGPLLKIIGETTNILQG